MTKSEAIDKLDDVYRKMQCTCTAVTGFVEGLKVMDRKPPEFVMAMIEELMECRYDLAQAIRFIEKEVEEEDADED